MGPKSNGVWDKGNPRGLGPRIASSTLATPTDSAMNLKICVQDVKGAADDFSLRVIQVCPPEEAEGELERGDYDLCSCGPLTQYDAFVPGKAEPFCLNGCFGSIGDAPQKRFRLFQSEAACKAAGYTVETTNPHILDPSRLLAPRRKSSSTPSGARSD